MHIVPIILRITGVGNEAMVIDATGAVTKPDQPAFLATVSTTQTNIADGHVVIVQRYRKI